MGRRAPGLRSLPSGRGRRPLWRSTLQTTAVQEQGAPGVQLEQMLQTPLPQEKILQLTETHQRLRKELHLTGGPLEGDATPCARGTWARDSNDKTSEFTGKDPKVGSDVSMVNAVELAGSPSRIVFVDQKVASELLRRIIPSSRYGGARRQKVRRVRAQLQHSLEASFRDAMAKPPAVLRLSQDSRLLLRADDGTGVEATLCGSPEQLEDFWKAVAIHQSFFEVLPNRRKANTELPYPVFICSKGRASSGFLNWRTEHCLGSDSSGACLPRASWGSAGELISRNLKRSLFLRFFCT
ncbi:unnamed protein product [Cladocopium goreaui]|uniref:TET-Associated Glycosyltransferase domain-containing protein n=1 Tax=Cladocopium goreaui TaxID=2562237 RepID=A0A9P1CRP7_9DINO|nr:unnamed protein product [Cladocopium goreaui]